MQASQLKIIADSLETKASIVTPANQSEAGQWRRIAAAVEALTATSSTANPTVEGYMLRTARALDADVGVTENHSYEGYLKRIVDGLEAKSSPSVGSYEHRAQLASIAATFGFNVASLFAASEPGAWYDPSDLSSMFQDSAGTTPAAVNQPVGRINDKSGRGNHAVQASTAAKPTLRQDATGYYLEHDGVDDRLMSGSFALGTNWHRISALRQISWASVEYIFSGAANGVTGLIQYAPSPDMVIYDGGAVNTAGLNSGLAIGVNGVVTEQHNSPNSRLAVNNGAYVVADTGPNAGDGIAIGGPGHDPSGHSNIRVYGMVIRAGAMSDADISGVRSYLAGKSGVTL